MLILGKNKVYLEKGEVIPCQCGECQHIYQPPKGSISSLCPKCGGANLHEGQEWGKRKRGEK